MQLLSKISTSKVVYYQHFSQFLSIYSNFSLGFLWKDFHKKPREMLTA